MKRILTHADIQIAAHTAALRLKPRAEHKGGRLTVFAVPRGGIPALYALQAAVLHHRMGYEVHPTIAPETADVIFDDLVDSGRTEEHYHCVNPTAIFESLFRKGTDDCAKDTWLVFPWEETEERSIEDNFVRLLQYVGEDPKRGGLLETPTRMAKAWKDWTAGYAMDPVAVLKTFEDGGELYDEMVHVKQIPFYSHCEHHLAPFFGHVTFAYIPEKKIVGLSKMSRLVNVFAKRLQVQERMTAQILDTFVQHLAPKGAGIKVTARHLCMESRGVQQQGAVTTTSRFTGVLRSDPSARAEFFSLSNGSL